MMTDSLLVILNALPEPVFLADADRRITLANGAARQLFGEGLIGKDFLDAVRHPDALNCIDAVLSGQAKAETVISLPVPVRTTYRVSAMRLGSSDESGATAVISLHDISHVLEAEQMRSDFVANVSHELRSPLTALSGGIETLKGAAKEDAAGRKRFLDIMEREAARMNRLVGDLLSLSSVEVNEHVRPSEKVNVLGVVESVVASLETQARAEKKPIRLERPEDDWYVLGDEDELTQVFQNLIENALRYSREESEVSVSFSGLDRVSGIEGPALGIVVKDQGEGIAADNIPRLTERFYRVDGSRSREKGGTGLGLAIVKHILNRHRGRLIIESEKGVGSTFTACLPLPLAVQKKPVS